MLASAFYQACEGDAFGGVLVTKSSVQTARRRLGEVTSKCRDQYPCRLPVPAAHRDKVICQRLVTSHVNVVQILKKITAQGK